MCTRNKRAGSETFRPCVGGPRCAKPGAKLDKSAGCLWLSEADLALHNPAQIPEVEVEVAEAIARAASSA